MNTTHIALTAPKVAATATRIVEPTAEQFTALRLMFDHFNRELFAGELPAVLLNLSRYTTRTIAFFAPNRWQDASGERTHEISLNPAFLADGTAAETASSLVHEMCHLWQHVFGAVSPKTGRRGPRTGYHDREWSEKMVAVGLTPIDAKTGKPSMSAPSMDHAIAPGGRFVEAFGALPAEALLPWSCLEARRRNPEKQPAPGEGEDTEPGTGGDTPSAPKAKNKIKYSCPKCNANAWGKPALRLACLNVEDHEDGAPAVFEALA